VYWGHYMTDSDRETLHPYHYCHEHKHLVPNPEDPKVYWHLPSKQITRNRRGIDRLYPCGWAWCSVVDP